MRVLSSTASKIFPNTPIAQKGMKIGLLGGSFNPPHEGHRHISLVAMKRLQLDKVWWIVTPGNPLKSHHNLLPLSKRIEQCQKCSAHPNIDITSFEEQRQSSYTYQTLSYLKQRYSETQFVWLMGADNIINFHKWKNWQRIAATMPFVIVDRPSFRLKAMASRFAFFLDSSRKIESEAKKIPSSKPPSWAFLTAQLCSISSTEIRKDS